MARSRHKQQGRVLAGVPVLGRSTSRATRTASCVPVGTDDTVCLSSDQQGELRIEGSPTRRLGCGSFACVFPRRNDRKTVVKITSDADDVAGLLALQGHPNVVKVHAAYRLRKKASDGVSKFYALVVDRLWEPSDNLRTAFDEINSEFGRGAGEGDDGSIWKATKSPRFGTRGYRFAGVS